MAYIKKHNIYKLPLIQIAKFAEILNEKKTKS